MGHYARRPVDATSDPGTRMLLRRPGRLCSLRRVTSLRLAILGFVVVMVAANPAEARRGRGGIVVINVGDDIMHLRQTSFEPVVSEDGRETSVDNIGYHYQRFGLFWVDLWRWGGEYVLYSGETYAPLTDDELAELGGARFPIAYHLPPGFLLLVCAGIFGLIKRRSRSVKFCLIAGGSLIAIALVLFLAGLGLGAMIPGFLGLYHLAAAKFGTAPEPDDDDDVVSAEPEPEQPRPRPSFRPPAPRVETDPFRAPPQQAPIHVERPSAPVVAPIAVDPNAEAPKLLR